MSNWDSGRKNFCLHSKLLHHVSCGEIVAGNQFLSSNEGRYVFVIDATQQRGYSCEDETLLQDNKVAEFLIEQKMGQWDFLGAKVANSS